MAKRSGMPKSWIATWRASDIRAFRAKRWGQSRRYRARVARERISGGSTRGEHAGGSSTWISTHWREIRCMHARRCTLRGQSCQRSGAEPTRSGCSSTLTWRGFVVALPFHWHCSRREQERQLRMLAPYTTRRLPSASRRCSCGSNVCLAGHRNVPLGWKAKSWPEKRPAFQAKPTCGEHSRREEPCVVA